MKAAVVHDFTKTAQRRGGPEAGPRPGRGAGQGRDRRACATPTSTPRTATGRSSRPRRSSPVTRASGSSSRSAPASSTPKVGDRVAMPWLGVGLRGLRVLRRRVGDAVREAGQHRLRPGRRLRRVRHGERGLRRAGPRRGGPAGRGRADLRRRDDLQGGQAVRRPPGSAGGDLRHRRPRPPRAAVRQDQRRHRRRGRHQPTRSSNWPRNSAPTTSSTR